MSGRRRDTPPRQLSVDEYRAIVGGGDRPTDTQCRAFVDHVCKAHSWYKHLPPVPPGVPFVFFLDPNAGRERVGEASGAVTYRDVVPKDDSYHYSMLPTREYWASFGHLVYATSSGTRVLEVRDGRTHSWDARVSLIYDEDGVPWRLPRDVLEAGVVRLTAMIHESGPSLWFGIPRPPEFFEGTAWPEETGGAETLAKLEAFALSSRERLAECAPAPGVPSSPSEARDPKAAAAESRRRWEDPEYRKRSREEERRLETIIAPERERQRGLMLDAIQRVVRTVHE